MRAALIAMAVTTAACRKADTTVSPPSVDAEAPVASALAPPPPADHLAPGELVEGAEQAFGLTLPKGVHVEESFVDVAYARGPVGVHPVVQYLRRHLSGGSVHEGEASATFEGVAAPANPGVELLVHVAAWAGGVRLEIRDATPPPGPILPDEPSRWRRVGLTPEGRIADPTHLD